MILCSSDNEYVFTDLYKKNAVKELIGTSYPEDILRLFFESVGRVRECDLRLYADKRSARSRLLRFLIQDKLNSDIYSSSFFSEKNITNHKCDIPITLEMIFYVLSSETSGYVLYDKFFDDKAFLIPDEMESLNLIKKKLNKDLTDYDESAQVYDLINCRISQIDEKLVAQFKQRYMEKCWFPSLFARRVPSLKTIDEVVEFSKNDATARRLLATS